MTQQCRDLELICEIERRRRLVEQQHLRRLRQRARNHHALLFAAAERCERARFERGGARRRQRLARDLLVARVLERERAQMRVSSHQHHVDDGEVERRMRLLRYHGDSSREIAAGQPLDRTLVDENAARQRRQNSREHAQQRGLPRSIRPEQADDAAAIDVQRDAIQHARRRRAPSASSTVTSIAQHPER